VTRPVNAVIEQTPHTVERGH